MNRCWTVLALLLAVLVNLGAVAQQQSTGPSRDLLRSFNPTGSTPDAVAVDPRTNIVYVGGLNRVTMHSAATGAVVGRVDDACNSNSDSSYVSIDYLIVLQSALFISCDDIGDRIGRTVDLKTGMAISRTLGGDTLDIRDCSRTLTSSFFRYLKIYQDNPKWEVFTLTKGICNLVDLSAIRFGVTK